MSIDFSELSELAALVQEVKEENPVQETEVEVYEEVIPGLSPVIESSKTE